MKGMDLEICVKIRKISSISELTLLLDEGLFQKMTNCSDDKTLLKCSDPNKFKYLLPMED